MVIINIKIKIISVEHYAKNKIVLNIIYRLTFVYIIHNLYQLLSIADKDAKATPRLPNIETYACVANLLVAELSSFLGTNITEPGYKFTSWGLLAKRFLFFEYLCVSPFG